MQIGIATKYKEGRKTSSTKKPSLQCCRNLIINIKKFLERKEQIQHEDAVCSIADVITISKRPLLASIWLLHTLFISLLV